MAARRCFDLYDMLLLSLILLHVAINPYTKVEETFIINNIYDHLFIPQQVADYDFQEFPGVVARSFLSSLLVAFFSYPLHYALVLLEASPLLSLYLARAVLGTLLFLSLKHLRSTVESLLHCTLTGESFFMLYVVQFHTVFYVNRPLPNTFALLLCNIAFAQWLQRRWGTTIVLLAFASIVFRCDIVVLAFAMILVDLIRGRLPYGRVFVCGLTSSLVFIGITVAVDSFFWGRLLWPELEVLLFNTVDNRSSEWGVSPWHWYFLSAIPKSVTLAVPLTAVGLFYRPRKRLVDPDVAYVIAPALIFVALYSFLPHKELRFIFPALTLFNLAGAMGLAKIMKRLSKSEVLNALLVVFATGLLVGSLAFSVLSTYVSCHNYPGGEAMRFFNREYPVKVLGGVKGEWDAASGLPTPYVHVDVYPAMTGITRFTYENEKFGWGYNRTEHLNDEDLQVFTHLISDRREIPGFKLYKSPIKGFHRIEWRKMKVRFKNLVFVHERDDVFQKQKELDSNRKKRGHGSCAGREELTL